VAAAWVLTGLSALAADPEQEPTAMVPFGETAAAAEGLTPGDDFARVLSVLGEPRGRLTRGATVLLFYDRGTVTMRDGRVTALSLVSSAEGDRLHAVRQERAAAADQRRNAAAAAYATQQMGAAEKEAKLQDAAFAAEPPEKRLAYWREFQQRYPGVPVDDQIAAIEGQSGGATTNAAGQSSDKSPAKSERQKIEEQIAADEKELESLRSASGLSRGGLVKARARMEALRTELDGLRTRLAAPPGQ
jgi:hypothetical protein